MIYNVIKIYKENKYYKILDLKISKLYLKKYKTINNIYKNVKFYVGNEINFYYNNFDLDIYITNNFLKSTQKRII